MEEEEDTEGAFVDEAAEKEKGKEGGRACVYLHGILDLSCMAEWTERVIQSWP